MLILALDVCDTRGSVAVLSDRQLLAETRHDSDEDYSAWLLPAVKRALHAAGTSLRDIGLFCAATGPGSFTALRVGLTTLKAWSEVYGRPIAAVSRLEAIASFAGGDAPWVAAFVNAQRGQVFGALFRTEGRWQRKGDEVVQRPEDFLRSVDQLTATETVAWTSLDPEIVESLPSWRVDGRQRQPVVRVRPELAQRIGRIGCEKAERGELTDALRLDADYVRRSDAEIFWKGNVPNAK